MRVVEIIIVSIVQLPCLLGDYGIVARLPRGRGRLRWRLRRPGSRCSDGNGRLRLRGTGTAGSAAGQAGRQAGGVYGAPCSWGMFNKERAMAQLV